MKHLCIFYTQGNENPTLPSLCGEGPEERSLRTKTIKFILAAIVTLWACSQVIAQDNLPYRPLKSFKNDTVRYLEYNFNKRSVHYIDKTMADFIKDLELSIVYLNNFNIIQKWSPAKRLINRMNLGICMTNMKPDNGTDYYVTVTLETGVDSEEFYKAAYFDKREVIHWTSKLYEVLKDFKITDIRTNPRLVKNKKK
jgi:hypothetical protein